MHEIEQLADTWSVFRNGRHIETFAKGSHTDAEVVQLMIGREITQVFPPKPLPTGRRRTMLEVERLGWGDRLKDISFAVHEGEIVGLGGLDGQGQRELLLALFGVLRSVDGEIRIDGRAVTINGPSAAKASGIDMALIPEDRKTEGLMLPMSIGENLSMAALGSLANGPLIDRGRETDAIRAMIDKLRIKIGSTGDAVATLSGGNQQKVVIGKWLMTAPKVILLNDPTRGIDVGTKQELYQLLRDLAADGAAILFYTTDYDELIGCCDRVLILYDGAITNELEGNAINETNIVASALNISTEKAAAFS
jgi:ribose transport system ATP-binding protein